MSPLRLAMGTGTAIAGMGASVGIVLLIIGVLLSLTGIGALLGIPLIIIGLVAIAGGAATGATVGAVTTSYKLAKESAKELESADLVVGNDYVFQEVLDISPKVSIKLI